jgi:hypothetical protein
MLLVASDGLQSHQNKLPCSALWKKTQEFAKVQKILKEDKSYFLHHL